MIVRYDPVMRHLLGTESTSDAEAVAEALTAQGVSFVDVDGTLPGYFEDSGVDFDGRLVLLEELPDTCRPDDIRADRPTAVPALPDLPSGGEVEPPPGTVLGSGVTAVTVRAPLHKAHRFWIAVYTAEDARRDLTVDATRRRDEIEVGGIVFLGHRIASDDRSALKVIRALEASRRDPLWSTIWECADGTALPMDPARIAALDAALQAHHDAVFARFSAVKQQIQDQVLTTTDQVDAAMAAPITV